MVERAKFNQKCLFLDPCSLCRDSLGVRKAPFGSEKIFPLNYMSLVTATGPVFTDRGVPGPLAKVQLRVRTRRKVIAVILVLNALIFTSST